MNLFSIELSLFGWNYFTVPVTAGCYLCSGFNILFAWICLFVVSTISDQFSDI
jgi:hypothetical protein